MEPASSIISKFAVDGPPKISGEAKVAEITRTAYTAPYRWQSERSKGGTGGTIPQKYHRPLLDYASANGIELKAEDFLPPIQSEMTSPLEGESADEPERAAS